MTGFACASTYACALAIMCVCAVVCVECAPTSSSPTGTGRRVILISVDGMRIDYLPLAKDLNLTNIAALIEGGTVAKATLSVAPAMTFPAHTSMISGVNPNTHGILINCEDEWRKMKIPAETACGEHYFYEDIEGKTIFDVATASGLSVGTVDWPVTVGLEVDYNYPGNVADPENVKEAGWFMAALRGAAVRKLFPTPEHLWGVDDPKRGDIAVEILRAGAASGKPVDLLALHYNDLDGVQHGHGWMSPAAIAQLQLIDASIGKLRATVTELGLAETTAFVVVSDHGFMNITKTVNPQVVFNAFGLVGETVLPYVGSTGGFFPVFLAPNASADNIARLDNVLDYMKSQTNLGIRKIYGEAELKAKGCFRGAHAAIEFEMGTDYDVMIEGSVISAVRDKVGQHGYPPWRPEMYASFVAAGAGVKSAFAIDEAHLIDVAPTIAQLLGIRLDWAVEGRALSEIFV
eukprot:Opistho-2@24232